MVGKILIKRYEIYLANLDPTLGSEMKKTRPVVVISDNGMNKYLNTVVACPLTTTLHPTWRSRVQVDCAGTVSDVAVDQIRAIDKRRLSKKLDELSNDEALKLRLLVNEMYGEKC